MASNSKIGLIIKHEYLTRIRKKSFWLVGILTPLAIVAVGALIGFLSFMNEKDVSQVAVYDLSGRIGPRLEGRDNIEFIQLDPALSVDSVKSLVRSDRSIKGVLYVPQDTTADYSVIEKGMYVYYSENVPMAVQGDITRQVERMIQDRKIELLGVNPEILAKTKTSVNLTMVDMSGQDGEKEESDLVQGVKYGLAFALCIMLYMFMVFSGNMVMTSTLEEKNQPYSRSDNFLRTAVRPYGRQDNKFRSGMPDATRSMGGHANVPFVDRRCGRKFCSGQKGCGTYDGNDSANVVFRSGCGSDRSRCIVRYGQGGRSDDRSVADRFPDDRHSIDSVFHSGIPALRIALRGSGRGSGLSERCRTVRHAAYDTAIVGILLCDNHHKQPQRPCCFLDVNDSAHIASGNDGAGSVRSPGMGDRAFGPFASGHFPGADMGGGQDLPHRLAFIRHETFVQRFVEVDKTVLGVI